MPGHSYGWTRPRWGAAIGEPVFHPPRRLLRALPPAADMRSAMPPIYDQGQLGSCFPAGTRIRMADGSNKPIETVRLLDEVLTAEGRTGKVLHTMARPEARGLIHLKLWGHNFLRLTAEHPVLTTRGYVAAGQLSRDDWVALPRYLPARTVLLVTEQHVTWRERIRNCGKRNYAGVSGRGGVSVSVKAVPDVIRLTPAFGRILGLFLSEGNTDKNKVVWTFSAEEEHTLATELVRLLGSELGIEGRIQRRGNGAVKVNVYGTAWAKLFESLCSTGAGMKRLHQDISSGPTDFMDAMLQGWLDGDGHHAERGWGGVSISHDLALSMYDIAQALGRRPVINWGKATESPGVKVRQPRWTVEMASQSDNWRVRQIDSHVWRKVRGVEEEEFSGYVFNLSVEGDESYVAEGIGVHNCTANACAGAVQYDEGAEGVSPTVMPSRLFQYYNSRLIEGTTGQDAGATIQDSVKSVVQYGFAPEALWPYDVSQFATAPPQSVYQAAAGEKVTDYAAVVQTLDAIRGTLAGGRPVLYGFDVPQEFESVGPDGVMTMPPASFTPLGGHANLLVGYSDTMSANGLTGYFVTRNSWGTSWGQAGYGYMPYAFITGASCSDFWVINTVPAPAPGPTPPPPPPPTPPPPGPGQIVGGFHLARRSPAGQPILWAHPKVTLEAGNYDVSGPV